MRVAYNVLICGVWQVPFSITTGFGFSDWQWWLVMLGVVLYRNLPRAEVWVAQR